MVAETPIQKSGGSVPMPSMLRRTVISRYEKRMSTDTTATDRVGVFMSPMTCLDGFIRSFEVRWIIAHMYTHMHIGAMSAW